MLSENYNIQYIKGNKRLSVADMQALQEKPESKLNQLEKRLLEDQKAADTMRKILEGRMGRYNPAKPQENGKYK